MEYIQTNVMRYRSSVFLRQQTILEKSLTNIMTIRVEHQTQIEVGSAASVLSIFKPISLLRTIETSCILAQIGHSIVSSLIQ